MTDPIDELFEDLRDYPGKRKPVGRDRVHNKSGPGDLTTWDEKPRIYALKGVDTEFFTIRHLAKAMDRSVRTIRMWEAHEVIPPATFRSTAPKKSKLKEAGDRLWTRAQVEAMVRIAMEEGVLNGKPPSKRFTTRVTQAFLALRHSTS